MPAISASAPGKIILFGEHAVVYGQPAIAVPVMQVKAKAIVTAEIGQPNSTIHIDAPDIELNGPLKGFSIDHAISQAVDLTIKELAVSNYPAFNLRLTSTIPLASGLGSGAAVSVAIIRAVSEFLGKRLSDEIVSQLTFEVEKIHHGTPSGIDNTVVTYGQAVYFIKDQSAVLLKIKKPFTILIADTGIKSSTAVSVAKVRKNWESDKEIYDAYFEACGLIARKAKKFIEEGKNENLGPLMNDNQSYLKKMGVSSPELDKLVEVAIEAGALGAKLSGGGMGGNMIALVDADHAEHIAQTLEQVGAANTIITRVGE